MMNKQYTIFSFFPKFYSSPLSEFSKVNAPDSPPYVSPLTGHYDLMRNRSFFHSTYLSPSLDSTVKACQRRCDMYLKRVTVFSYNVSAADSLGPTAAASGRWICLICIPQVHPVFAFVTVFRQYNATNVAIIPLSPWSILPEFLIIC